MLSNFKVGFQFLFTSLLLLAPHVSLAAGGAAAATSAAIPTSSKIVTAPSTSSTKPITVGTVTTSSSAFDPSAPPDVLLQVPQLSVAKIELDVDNLQADINLAANVANLVSINAGVQVSVQQINITITNIDVTLDLSVRLGHLVDIVSRVFSSLDLNPLLINTLNNVTSLVDTVVGAVDGLLGSITQGGNVLNFIVDNLGNIVQEVTTTAGSVTSTIVGDYLTNMTATGAVEQLGNGLVQKTFSYSPLNALVNIVFNTAGQVVSAVVQKGTTTTTSGGSSSSSGTVILSSATAAARRK